MRRFHCRSARWHGPTDSSPEWMQKRRFMFFRFARFLAAAFVLFLMGMAGLAFLLARLFDGSGQYTFILWLLGCGLALSIPLLAGIFALRSFSSVVNPLARVMAAADAVADGDLSVRVPEGGPGEFGKFAQSFNRMVAELERSDQLRRNLTADVAHELRTPLHIIQGNLEGILDGVYEPDSEQMSLLLDETRQLARLVEDLRTLSLAEAGQLALDHTQVDIDELLSDVVTSFSGQAEAAQIDLAIRADSISSLKVSGDAGRLDQVLSNLIVNALSHNHPGGRITLCAMQAADGIQIFVSDDGDGISTEDLPFIFDRFWRSDPARQSGSGLGLAIARQLVNAHGGVISVESQPDQGTTFRINLPAAPA